jgi:CobQ-like glutamine amidotransferase family enzyme
MSVTLLHLFPSQLGLNGEAGNVSCLLKRLEWAGHKGSVVVYDGAGDIPTAVDAVFIGSGTLAGAIEALRLLSKGKQELEELANSGVPFLALGLGWEILGESLTLTDGELIHGVGVYPSKSIRCNQRASAESFGFDPNQNLTTGYANHQSVIELAPGVSPWITLSEGYGNSSIEKADLRPDEGLRHKGLFAARLNGPLLPLNPHLADEFLAVVAKKSGFEYVQESSDAQRADGFALNARAELKKRLTR